ncbi:hypothetical protein [Asticcacaulis sp. W401b]|uniref:hypothetical protein n=1 Tax=Asticcacaulis sp. W401b TaxID=3388666 RepID=UPI0039706CD7
MDLDFDKLKIATAAIHRTVEGLNALPGPLVGGQAAAAGTLRSIHNRLATLVDVWTERGLNQSERAEPGRAALSIKWLMEDDWVASGFNNLPIPSLDGQSLVDYREGMRTLYDLVIDAGA